MQGRRLPDIGVDEYFDDRDMQPGDYVRLYGGKHWVACAPNGDLGTITTHRTTVHDDQTITVSPSLQFETGKRWHGYLEKGIWREC